MRHNAPARAARDCGVPRCLRSRVARWSRSDGRTERCEEGGTMARRESSTGSMLDVDRTFNDLMQRMMRWPLGWVQRGDGNDEPVCVAAADRRLLTWRGPRDPSGAAPHRSRARRRHHGAERDAGPSRRTASTAGHGGEGSLLPGRDDARVVPADDPAPGTAKTDKISARYEDGVLEITVPEGAAAESSRKVPVQSGAKRGNGSRAASGGE